MKNILKIRKTIPVVFATDDNYAPFLIVALQAIFENSHDEFLYKIYVLETNLGKDYKAKIMAYSKGNISVRFVNVTSELDQIGGLLHLRDYYTKVTYYRFFIPNLFPQYKKVLYLDCDIVLLQDVADLYNHDLGDCYVAAAVEDVMTNYECFGNYVEKALGINRYRYFNAGVLLMNLKQLRAISLENQFVDLISRFTFRVTQDEDYLNVLCQGHILWLDRGWNKCPIIESDFSEENLKLVHYKIGLKPWHYYNVPYENYFWHFAKNSTENEFLLAMRENYSDEEKLKDERGFQALVAKAESDAADKNNYYNTLLFQEKRREEEAQAEQFSLSNNLFKPVVG